MNLGTGGTHTITVPWSLDITDSGSFCYLSGPSVIYGTANPPSINNTFGNHPATIDVTFTIPSNAPLGNYDIYTNINYVLSGDGYEAQYHLAVNVVPGIPGCTNPAATNYNPAANVDDGSCTFGPPPPSPPTNVKIIAGPGGGTPGPAPVIGWDPVPGATTYQIFTAPTGFGPFTPTTPPTTTTTTSTTFSNFGNLPVFVVVVAYNGTTPSNQSAPVPLLPLNANALGSLQRGVPRRARVRR